MLKLGVVIPVGPGRQDNLNQALAYLFRTHNPISCVVAVLDGPEVSMPWMQHASFHALRTPRHEPSMEQPRNLGVRHMMELRPDITHVAFLDSDIIVTPCWRDEIEAAYAMGSPERVMAAPYDWLPAGNRNIAPDLKNDPRWPLFKYVEPSEVFRADISAGLACFTGNLIWPIDEFMRVGGFWSEIHHGRCEDGELGLRAASMGVPISFAAKARGWHLWHPVNRKLVLERNERDVPMLNKRHPWVQGSNVILVDRDGAAFDVLCPNCSTQVPTIDWWMHCSDCNVAMKIPVNVS